MGKINNKTEISTVNQQRGIYRDKEMSEYAVACCRRVGTETCGPSTEDPTFVSLRDWWRDDVPGRKLGGSWLEPQN